MTYRARCEARRTRMRRAPRFLTYNAGSISFTIDDGRTKRWYTAGDLNWDAPEPPFAMRAVPIDEDADEPMPVMTEGMNGFDVEFECTIPPSAALVQLLEFIDDTPPERKSN